jgi:hypothetical protein
MTFPKDALPPLDRTRGGFWSLTMYDKAAQVGPRIGLLLAPRIPLPDALRQQVQVLLVRHIGK